VVDPAFFRRADDSRWHVVDDDGSDFAAGRLVSFCGELEDTFGLFADGIQTALVVPDRFVCFSCGSLLKEHLECQASVRRR
jgi:hypothetical protein